MHSNPSIIFQIWLFCILNDGIILQFWFPTNKKNLFIYLAFSIGNAQSILLLLLLHLMQAIKFVPHNMGLP